MMKSLIALTLAATCLAASAQTGYVGWISGNTVTVVPAVQESPAPTIAYKLPPSPDLPARPPLNFDCGSCSVQLPSFAPQEVPHVDARERQAEEYARIALAEDIAQNWITNATVAYGYSRGRSTLEIVQAVEKVKQADAVYVKTHANQPHVCDYDGQQGVCHPI